MKSSWIGIGFSHHSVPSLSKTATRSATGTGGAPPVPHTAETNARTASRAGPARQHESVPCGTASRTASWPRVMGRPFPLGGAGGSPGTGELRLRSDPWSRGGRARRSVDLVVAMHRRELRGRGQVGQRLALRGQEARPRTDRAGPGELGSRVRAGATSTADGDVAVVG